MERLGDKIAHRQSMLEHVRNDYEALQDEALQKSYPNRGGIQDENAIPGQKHGADVFDDVAIDSLRIWSDGLHSNHASPALDWFRFKFSESELNEDQRLKIWLEEVEGVVREGLLRSNFYDQFNMWLRDAGSVGYGSMWLENNPRRSTTDIVVPHPREIYIARDKFGFVNTIHRKFKMTMAQAREEFGDDFLLNERPEQKQDPYFEYEFVRAIYRNDDTLAREFPALLRNRPYVTCFIMLQQQEEKKAELVKNDDGTLKKSAFDSINPIVWGPRLNSDEVYPRSPTMDAIVAIKRADQFGYINMEGAQRAVQPNFLAPEALEGKMSLVPFTGAYYKGTFEENRVQELFRPDGLPLSEAREEFIRQTVKDYFHVDLFTALFAGGVSDKVLTATQFLGIRDARAVLMTPLLGSLNGALSSMFERFVQSEFSQGRLPETPPELDDIPNASFLIDYIGPLAQAQRRLSASLNIENTLEKLGQAAALLGPEITDGVDPYLLGDEIMDNSGLPEKLQIPFEKRIEKGKQRRVIQKAALEQEQATTSNVQADTVNKLQQAS